VKIRHRKHRILSGKDKAMPAAPEATFTQLFDQAVETFGGAVKASIKLQEDVAKFWTDAFDRVGPAQDWQKRSRSIFTEALPTAQKSADEYLRLFDASCRSSIDLVKKVVEATKAETPSEAQNKAQAVVEDALANVRATAKALTEANIRALESFADFVRKTVDVAKPACATKGNGQ
jgi:hypothetical protein